MPLFGNLGFGGIFDHLFGGPNGIAGDPNALLNAPDTANLLPLNQLTTPNPAAAAASPVANQITGPAANDTGFFNKENMSKIQDAIKAIAPPQQSTPQPATAPVGSGVMGAQPLGAMGGGASPDMGNITQLLMKLLAARGGGGGAMMPNSGGIPSLGSGLGRR